MSTNKKLSSLRIEAAKQLILETAFSLFSENTIEKITMTDVAKAVGVGVATVYRYFNTKQNLVLETGTWVWKKYLDKSIQTLEKRETTAAEEFEYHLSVFLELYRSHRNVLRFNQFFNVYIGKERHISREAMKHYISLVEDVLLPRFEAMILRAEKDHTMRTDIPAKEIMLTSLHLMLAAATRYAVGLVYFDGYDPEKELVVLKDMLMEKYTN